MKALHKLGHLAAAAGLSAAIAFSAVPANASTEGRDALLGAGIGAVAGGLLGHGRVGSVVAGGAVGAAVGALAGHKNKHRYGYYYRRGYPHRYAYYHYRRGYYDSYGYFHPYG